MDEITQGIKIDVSASFNNKNTDTQLENLQLKFQKLKESCEEAADKIVELEAEVRRLEEENSNLKDNGYIKGLNNQLEKFKLTARAAAAELTAFLRSSNVANAFESGELRFADEFKAVREGAMTANMAITKIKTEHPEFFGGGQGGADNQALQGVLASLTTLSDKLDTIIAQMDHAPEGVTKLGESADNEAQKVTGALVGIQNALNDMGSDAQAASEPVINLFHALSEYGNIDDKRLYYVAQSIESIALLAKGHFGEGSVKNIINLATQLSKIDTKSITFDTAKFNALHISKASYENLATYLPQIAEVNANKLAKLAGIDFSNLNNIKITKGNAQGLVELANALNSVAEALGAVQKVGGGGGGGIFGGGGPGGPNNPWTPKDFTNMLKEYKEAQRTMRTFYKEAAQEGSGITYGLDGNLMFSDAREAAKQQYDEAAAKIQSVKEKMAQLAQQGEVTQGALSGAFQTLQTGIAKADLETQNVIDRTELSLVKRWDKMSQQHLSEMLKSEAADAKQAISELNSVLSEYKTAQNIIRSAYAEAGKTGSGVSLLANGGLQFDSTRSALEDNFNRAQASAQNLRQTISAVAQTAQSMRPEVAEAFNGIVEGMDRADLETQNVMQRVGVALDNIKTKEQEAFDADIFSKQRAELNDYLSDYRKYASVIQSVARLGLRDNTAVWMGSDGKLQFSEERQEMAQLYSEAERATSDIEARLVLFRDNASGEAKALANDILAEINTVKLKNMNSFKDMEENAAALYSKLQRRARDYYKEMMDTKAAKDPTAVQLLKRVNDLAKNADPSNYQEVVRAMKEANNYIIKNDLDSQTWFQRLKKNFGSRLRSILSGMIIGKITMAIRQVYTNVVDIDTAMTQLKIVTGATDAQMTKFLTNSTKLAKELGATISDVLKSVETFSRLGYGMEDATELAKYANILSKVAAVSSDEATKGLTSIIKGYGFDPDNAEHVADVLISVGQKYAVSASELMEAYKKAGAALNASNTSFEESAGLIAAANAAVQDASVVGTALKTVSARIRKSTVDLKELQDDTDDLIGAWSKYAREIKKLSGFNIMVEGSDTQFKNLYEIFEGIGKVAGELDETSLSRIAEILGGTKQASVIYSILSNWGDAAGAFASAMDSAGTSTEALDKYTNSIQGKVNQLKTTFAELSMNILSSDLVAEAVDLLKAIINIANGIIKVSNNLLGAKGTLAQIVLLIVWIKRAAIAKSILSMVKHIKIMIRSFQSARAAGMNFGQTLKKVFSTSSGGVVGIVIAAIAIITAAISAAVNDIRQNEERLAQKHQELLDRLKEESRESLSLADDYKNNADELATLIEKYKELGGQEDAPMDEIEDIQKRIVELVGDHGKQIDVVNGKLEEQLGILQNITEEEAKKARKEAESALVAAKEAINSTTITYKTPAYLSLTRFAPSDDFVDLYKEFLRYKEDLDYVATYGATEDVAKDYVWGSSLLSEYINDDGMVPGDVIQKTASWRKQYNNVTEFLNTYKDLYTNYMDAKNKLDELDSWTPTPKEPEGTKEFVLESYEVKDILGEIEDAYDAIASSMDDMNEHGAITVKTFNDMIKQGLDQYLIQTADGFELDEEAMQDYIGGLVETYGQVSKLQDMSLETKQIAIENLKNLRVALSMLALSTDQAKKAAEAQKKAYEDEKDLLKDQLNAYKELIDLRKDLLKQYKEELDYKKELAKKESNVASLQTKLAVSQLDTSAAGRAKTRQLEKELKEAQEELDDFTLEHAIDVVTNELDEQYEEYKKLIDGKLDAIEDRISELSGASSLGVVSQNILDLTEKVRVSYEAMEQLVERDQTDLAENSASKAASEASNAAISAINTAIAPVLTIGSNLVDVISSILPDQSIKNFVTSSVSRLKEFLSGKSGSSGDRYYHEEYKSSSGHTYSGGGRRIATHHSGGIVGNTTLKSTEEFAKLLKGEFVSTPAMMNRFMNRTLPNLVTAASNAFNAPLININCDTVTKDALPGLNQIVQQAVTQIKREFDTGMIRSGYRKSAQKIAI
jgi:TP901 family phage tail tape measure protein